MARVGCQWRLLRLVPPVGLSPFRPLLSSSPLFLIVTYHSGHLTGLSKAQVHHDAPLLASHSQPLLVLTDLHGASCKVPTLPASSIVKQMRFVAH